jgi:hypothetical protein
MRERIHFRKTYADTRRTSNQHQAAHLSKGKRDRSRLALAPQFSLNPHHRKKAMSRRTRPVHETSSDKCKRCGIIIHGSPTPCICRLAEVRKISTWAGPERGVDVPRRQWRIAFLLIRRKYVAAPTCSRSQENLNGLLTGGEMFSRYLSGVRSKFVILEK